MRSSLFWDITQCRLVDSYRRFEKTFRPQRQAWGNPSRQPGTLRYTVCRDGVGSDRLAQRVVLASTASRTYGTWKGEGQEGIQFAYGLPWGKSTTAQERHSSRNTWHFQMIPKCCPENVGNQRRIYVARHNRAAKTAYMPHFFVSLMILYTARYMARSDGRMSTEFII